MLQKAKVNQIEYKSNLNSLVKESYKPQKQECALKKY